MPKSIPAAPAKSSPPGLSSTANQPAPSGETNAPAAGQGMPSDRDQSTDMTATTPDPLIQQAAKDLKRGLSDTSKGAETDKAYQKQK